MKYVVRVLQPGESLVYLTSFHWLVYLRAIVLLIIALVLLIASAMQSHEGLQTGFKIGAAAFALLALGSWLHAVLRRITTELAVTDRRVIYKTGLFQRHTMEMNRSKVETVGVNQSILGRMLGYGTIVVRGTGGSFEPIRFIADPLTFRSHITAG